MTKTFIYRTAGMAGGNANDSGDYPEMTFTEKNKSLLIEH
jgi:hypothetical protein